MWLFIIICLGFIQKLSSLFVRDERKKENIKDLLFSVN